MSLHNVKKKKVVYLHLCCKISMYPVKKKNLTFNMLCWFARNSLLTPIKMAAMLELA